MSGAKDALLTDTTTLAPSPPLLLERLNQPLPFWNDTAAVQLVALVKETPKDCDAGLVPEAAVNDRDDGLTERDGLGNIMPPPPPGGGGASDVTVATFV